MTTSIRVDFWRDCIDWMRIQLTAQGHVPPSADAEVAAHFFNLQRRQIVPRPRTVSVARGIDVPSHCRSSFQRLLQKMAHGVDLNPHLSSSLQRSAIYNDALLNDWGMHHLHLGERVEENGLVERTKALVFAIVHWDRVYIAGLGVHGEWTAHRLIDAVHDDWPELLVHRRLPLAPGSRMNPAQHQLARRKGLLAITVLKDGTPVMAPGGGYATSGRSLRVSMRVIRTRQVMKELERRLMTLVGQILERLGESQDPGLDLHLTVTPDGAYAAEDERLLVRAILCTPAEAREAFRF